MDYPNLQHTTRLPRQTSPAPTVEPLPEELDRGLGPVELLGGHVDIVYEEDEFFAGRGTKDAFSSFLTLTVNQILQ